jgi:hypothetical protein
LKIESLKKKQIPLSLSKKKINLKNRTILFLMFISILSILDYFFSGLFSPIGSNSIYTNSLWSYFTASLVYGFIHPLEIINLILLLCFSYPILRKIEKENGFGRLLKLYTLISLSFAVLNLILFSLSQNYLFFMNVPIGLIHASLLFMISLFTTKQAINNEELNGSSNLGIIVIPLVSHIVTRVVALFITDKMILFPDIPINALGYVFFDIIALFLPFFIVMIQDSKKCDF